MITFRLALVCQIFFFFTSQKPFRIQTKKLDWVKFKKFINLEMESNLYEDFLNHSDAYDFGVNLIIEAADPASGYKSNFIKETKISLGGNIVDR